MSVRRHPLHVCKSSATPNPAFSFTPPSPTCVENPTLPYPLAWYTSSESRALTCATNECHYPMHRRGRPINPTSARQRAPWLTARISRRAYYRALALARAAGANTCSLDYLGILRAFARTNRLPARAAHQALLALGHDPTYTSPHYTTHAEAQAHDQAKRARSRSPNGGVLPGEDLGPLLIVGHDARSITTVEDEGLVGGA